MPMNTIISYNKKSNFCGSHDPTTNKFQWIRLLTHQTGINTSLTMYRAQRCVTLPSQTHADPMATYAIL